MTADNVTGLAHPYNHFFYVGLEANPVKHSRQDVQPLLDPGRPGRGYTPVIGIEECRQPLDRHLKAIRSHFLLNHQNEPVTNHCIKNHVKDGGV